MTNPTLLKAILSMDAYNRGYGAGLVFGDDPGDNNYSLDTNGIQIGEATIIRNLGNQLAQNINFYALAYDLNGDGQADTISFRGTDDAANDNYKFGKVAA